MAVKAHEVGDAATVVRSFSAEDVAAFATLSGDRNPIHLDADYAATTVFERPIAHGLFVSSVFSALIASELPGPGSIYLEQNLSFKAPVYLDEGIEFSVVVSEVVKPGLYRLTTTATRTADEVVCIEGSALVLLR